MENKKTSIFQAFKLYTGKNIIRHVVSISSALVIIFSLFGLLLKVTGWKCEGVACFTLNICSIFYYMNTSKFFNIRIIDYKFFKTTQYGVIMFQKYRIASHIAGLSVALLTYIPLGIIFSGINFTILHIILALFTRDVFYTVLLIVERLKLNINELKLTVAIVMLFYIFVYFPSIECGVVFNFLHLILSVLFIIWFVIIEKILLKRLQEIWYED